MSNPLPRRPFDASLRWHSLLALCSCALAWLAWTHPNLGNRDTNPIILSVPTAQLKTLLWRDAWGEVVVEKNAPESGQAARYSIKTRKKATNPNMASAQIWPAGSSLDALLERLNPLHAIRELGSATEPNQLQRLGLQPPQQTLQITLNDHSDSQTLEVGNGTFGSGDHYVRSPDNRLYLLRVGSLSSLQAGGLSLQDRNLVGLPERNFTRLLLQGSGQSRSLTYRHLGTPATAGAKTFLADPADPDTPLELANSFLERLLYQRIAELTLQAPSTPPSLSLTFWQDNNNLRQLDFFACDALLCPVRSSHQYQVALIPKAQLTLLLKDAEKLLTPPPNPTPVSPH